MNELHQRIHLIEAHVHLDKLALQCLKELGEEPDPEAVAAIRLVTKQQREALDWAFEGRALPPASTRTLEGTLRVGSVAKEGN